MELNEKESVGGLAGKRNIIVHPLTADKVSRAEAIFRMLENASPGELIKIAEREGLDDALGLEYLPA